MMINNACSLGTRFVLGDPFSENDCYISYLPAAHSIEQVLFAASCVYGVQIGFYSGDRDKLMEDIRILQPTYLPSEPRLLKQLQAKILEKFEEANGLKAVLIRKGLESKRCHILTGQSSFGSSSFYDKLVFDEIKMMLGGRVRTIINSNGPASGELIDFLRINFGCFVGEDYALTETCAAGCMTRKEDLQSGHVGGPLQNCKIRLRDIPELHFFHTDSPPRGEICFFGPGVTPGYFKNPYLTEQSKHNGWLLSGDVGTISSNGAVRIIDRLQNIFKLSQGQAIAPQKLENIYVQSELLLQAWIYGDLLRDYIVGIFVVDPHALAKFTSANNITPDLATEDAYVSNPDVREAVYASIIKLADTHKLNDAERPKQFLLLRNAFTVESGVLTPTDKLRRRVARKIHSQELHYVYSLPVLQKGQNQQIDFSVSFTPT